MVLGWQGNSDMIATITNRGSSASRAWAGAGRRWWRLLSKTPRIHGYDARGAGRYAQGHARWRLRRPGPGLFPSSRLGAACVVAGQRGVPSREPRGACMGPSVAAAAALASARAGAGRWRGLLLPPPLPPFLLDHGVEVAAPPEDIGSGALKVRSGAPRARGGARGGACA